MGSDNSCERLDDDNEQKVEELENRKTIKEKILSGSCPHQDFQEKIKECELKMKKKKIL